MGGLKWRLCYKKSRVLASARMPTLVYRFASKSDTGCLSISELSICRVCRFDIPPRFLQRSSVPKSCLAQFSIRQFGTGQWNILFQIVDKTSSVNCVSCFDFSQYNCWKNSSVLFQALQHRERKTVAYFGQVWLFVLRIYVPFGVILHAWIMWCTNIDKYHVWTLVGFKTFL